VVSVADLRSSALICGPISSSHTAVTSGAGVWVMFSRSPRSPAGGTLLVLVVGDRPANTAVIEGSVRPRLAEHRRAPARGVSAVRVGPAPSISRRDGTRGRAASATVAADDPRACVRLGQQADEPVGPRSGRPTRSRPQRPGGASRRTLRVRVAAVRPTSTDRGRDGVPRPKSPIQARAAPAADPGVGPFAHCLGPAHPPGRAGRPPATRPSATDGQTRGPGACGLFQGVDEHVQCDPRLGVRGSPLDGGS